MAIQTGSKILATDISERLGQNITSGTQAIVAHALKPGTARGALIKPADVDYAYIINNGSPALGGNWATHATTYFVDHGPGVENGWYHNEMDRKSITYNSSNYAIFKLCSTESAVDGGYWTGSKIDFSQFNQISITFHFVDSHGTPPNFYWLFSLITDLHAEPDVGGRYNARFFDNDTAKVLLSGSNLNKYTSNSRPSDTTYDSMSANTSLGTDQTFTISLNYSSQAYAFFGARRHNSSSGGNNDWYVYIKEIKLRYK